MMHNASVYSNAPFLFQRDSVVAEHIYMQKVQSEQL